MVVRGAYRKAFLCGVSLRVKALYGVIGLILLVVSAPITARVIGGVIVVCMAFMEARQLRAEARAEPYKLVLRGLARTRVLYWQDVATAKSVSGKGASLVSVTTCKGQTFKLDGVSSARGALYKTPVDEMVDEINRRAAEARGGTAIPSSVLAVIESAQERRLRRLVRTTVVSAIATVAAAVVVGFLGIVTDAVVLGAMALFEFYTAKRLAAAHKKRQQTGLTPILTDGAHSNGG